MLHKGRRLHRAVERFSAKLAAGTGYGVLVYSRYGHGGSGRAIAGEAAGRVHAPRRRSGAAAVAGQAERRPPNCSSVTAMAAPSRLSPPASIRSSQGAQSGSAARVRRRPATWPALSPRTASRRPACAPSSPAITNTWMKRSGDGTTSGWIRGFGHGTSNRICRRSAVPCCAFRAKRIGLKRAVAGLLRAISKPRAGDGGRSWRIASTRRIAISRKRRSSRWSSLCAR